MALVCCWLSNQGGLRDGSDVLGECWGMPHGYSIGCSHMHTSMWYSEFRLCDGMAMR